MSLKRLHQAFDMTYKCLRQKINGGCIRVESEASLQLQFAAILKSVGELLEIDRREHFSIELEKPVKHTAGVFGKSGSTKAKIDIYYAYTNMDTGESTSCAIEMKFFKKMNHREPNNRYDVFADLHNLENYAAFADSCFMVIATDHDHYVSQTTYSKDTGDFDFRNGRKYHAGTEMSYRTPKPHGQPITLANSYAFKWDRAAGGLHFLKLAVPIRKSRTPQKSSTKIPSA